MDKVIRQLMTEFCDDRDLAAWRPDEQFEAFTAHCVLSEYTFDSFNAADFRIGGSADGGIDSYAVAIGEKLFRDPAQLEDCFELSGDLSPTVIIVQAKTSAKMDRKIISDLRVRVENILRTDIALDNAADVEPLRECLRVMRKRMDRLSDRGVRLVVVYANTSTQANSEMLSEANRAKEALTGTGVVHEVEFQCLGRDALTQLYERAQSSATAKLTFLSHYELPAAPGVTRARQGVVSAADLVAALADENGSPNSTLFSENIREYQPTAPVNEEIRATLRDEAKRRRFAVLNNGVTIVARSLRAWNDSRVVMRDFQVVNGCQTCHVLAEERDHLDDVAVKVQLIECDDDDVVNDIVTATNRQTEIPRVYFINRNKLIRRLEVHYRSQLSDDRQLYFGRRPGKRSSLRVGVISLNQQLRAHIAMFGKLPPSSDHRDLGSDFDKLFGQASEEDFYLAASALYRWEWLVSTRRVNRNFRPLAYQAIAILSIMYGARTSRGSESEKAARRARIEKAIWSDGEWERIGYDIQPVLAAALEASSLSDPKAAGASLTFGQRVVEIARQLPRR
ncbi:AIPR family protein [Stackebrandtia soli]|uniref:AIPR family protein n=1 Tax=Stackebrandtia soli TaxID=1892856 RepID=UPI0039E76810